MTNSRTGSLHVRDIEDKVQTSKGDFASLGEIAFKSKK